MEASHLTSVVPAVSSSSLRNLPRFHLAERFCHEWTWSYVKCFFAPTGMLSGSLPVLNQPCIPGMSSLGHYVLSFFFFFYVLSFFFILLHSTC